MTIPSILTELGFLVSVTYETGDEAITFTFPKRGKMRMILACDGKGKNLYCMRMKPGGKKPRNSKSLSNAAKRYRLWSGYDVDSYRSLAVTERKLTNAGNITEIVYSSDKWDGWHEYVHKFKHTTRIKLDNHEDPKMVHITGSQLKVTKRGIEG